LTGVLVAGVLGCSADAEPQRSAGPDVRTTPDDDGSCPPGPESRRDQLPRMCAVADAWEGSDAACRWAEEFHPIDAHVQLPEGGLRDEFKNGAVRALTSLPDESADGAIRWEDGETSPVALMSAADAFGEMDSGIAERVEGYPAMEVTGVELGEMRLHTSRGPAQVPAWLFTLDGYDTPLRYAAVAVPNPPAAPIEPAADDRDLAGLALGPLSEDGRRITVTWWDGSCEESAIDVLETDESVVIARSVSGGPPPGTACTEEVTLVEKTLELERPLGERAPLDASTGEVLQPELLAPE
jgi:hypothetical protein